MKTRIKNFFPSLTFSSPLLTSLFPLLLTFLTLFAGSVASAQIPSTGLVGYWNFSGNVNDASSNGNNGIMQPGNNGSINFVTDRFGNANSAIQFSSNPAWNSLGPYIEIPNSQNLLVNSDFTMIYSIKVSAQNVIGEIINKGADAIANSYFSRVANGILQNSIPTSGIINVSNFPIGSWQTVTITYSNSLLSYYLNGVFQQSVASGPIQSSSSKYYFGSMVSGSSNGSYYPFQGIMDDISIYNRALTPAEITQVYTSQTSTVQPPCPTLATNLQTGLVGYWPFCGNANDESGNGNNGTVNGATLTTDRFGNANSAYSFDGVNDIITLNAIPMQNGTISIWFEESVLNNSNPNNGHPPIGSQLIGQGTGHQPSVTYCDFALGISSYNGGPEYYSFENSAVNSWTDYSLGTVGNNSVWNNIVIVIDGTQLSMYLNGSLFSSTTLSNALLNSGAPLSFGGRYVFQSSNGIYYHNFFKGNLDDICIYNRALTSAEISQLYTDPSTTPPLACTPFLGEDQTVCAGTSVTLTASGSSLACPTLPSTLQTGLVGYWPFCGNANDASGNGNNGTVNGATLTVDRFGNANSAYSFDGVNDYIVTNNISFANGGDYSISLWVKLNAAYSNGEPQHYLLSNATTLGGAYLNTDYNQSQFGCNSFYSDNSIGNWHHYVGIKSGNTYTLRIDNQVVGSVNNCNTNFINGYPVFFGNSSVNTEFTNGIIDDISIYTRALSVSEIQQLYTLGQSTYLWSTGATTATINVTPTTTTTYTCTVTDANGNVCTDSVTVFVPQIEATDLTICAGETTTLSVSGINSTATPSACPTLPANLQNGLVGYWPFCGNANDASGNGNNGTVNGATLTTDRFGNANSAYAFNVNYLTSIGISNLSGLNDWSIAFWCNPSSSNTSFLYYPIGINCQLYWKGIGLSGNNPPCGIPGQNLFLFDGSQGCSNWFAANSVFNYNSFNQFVITKSGLEYRIYQNGMLLNSSSSLEAISIQSLTLGRRCNDPSTNTLDGTIDDVILHNRALTTNEIQQLYNLGQTTYLWSNGATTPTINVSPTTTTTYTCTVTTNGVSCTDSVTVIVSNPVIDLGADVTVCGTSTTLTAPSGYDSYLWSNGGTTNTTTASSNGTYSCTGLINGCSATDSIDVVLVSLDAQVNVSSICSGEAVELTATSNLSVNQNSNCIGNTGSPNPWPYPSAYNAGIIDLGNFGAQSVFSISAWVNVGATQNGISILLDASHGGSANWVVQAFGNNTYTWGSLSFTLTPNVWQHVLLTYVNGSKKCFIDGQLVASVYNPISYSGSPQLYLGNWPEGGRRFNGLVDELYITYSELQSSNFVPSQVINTPSANSFGLWHFDEGANGTTLNSVSGTVAQIGSWFWASRPVVGNATISWNGVPGSSTQTLSPVVTTTYVSSVLINGLTCSDSVTVAVNNPVIDLGADVTVCGTSTTLTAPSGYDSYLWSNGGTANTTTVTTNGTYSCTATQGGCSASDSIDVTLIDASITASDSIVCAGETVTLSVPQGGSSNIACAALPTNLQTGLVGYWPFCGNANDESGNGNNGTVNGATLTTDRFGNANSAYSFDGNDWIESLIPQTLGYTVSGWVFLNTNNNYNGFAQHKNNCGRGGGYIFAIPNGGDVRLLKQNCGECGNNCSAQFSISNFSSVAIGEWKHLVATCDAINSHKVYLNGQLVYTQTNSSSIGQYGQQLFSIGKHHDSPDLYFLNGKADDFLLYNRALTAAEIQQLYTIGQTTYLWSNGATTATINVSPTSTTTYTCTVTTNGVSCTDSITVTVDVPTATITPASATTFCQGGSVVLNANSATGNARYIKFSSIYSEDNGQVNVYGIQAYSNGVDVALNQSGFANSYEFGDWSNNGIGAVDGGWWTRWSSNRNDPGPDVQNPHYIVIDLDLVYNLDSILIDIQGFDSWNQTFQVLTSTDSINWTLIAEETDVTGIFTYPLVGLNLSYQWQLNGVSINGATSPSYSANASGSYTVVVTNSSTCSSTSTATVVTVNALPTATITPATATTFCQGGSVVLNANTGTGLTYQWFNNTTAISGGTSASYTATTSGSYTVVVTNTSTCSATSSATVVTVNALPTATITPATATTFCQGGSVVLNANTGAGLTYQWFNNATAISGATSASYTATINGSYTVVVTNTSTCSATSTATVVTVNALPTSTITPATATTFCQGGSVVLNANTGAGLTYQWRLNGTNITGATTSSYTANASGSYTVVVTNTSTCSATSTATVVTVNALPTATITPATATTFCQGGSVVLNANTGAGLTYQWRLNGNPISGATTSSYTANASGSYTVVVTNTSACSATSTATVVTVNALPTATITPATTTTFCQGGSVVFNANTGAGLTYQWRLNGTNITGATSSSYTANASGSYTVVVTNTSTCLATSTATVVTVNALPTATITASSATTFCQGGSVVLNANTGTGLSYQWYNNAAIISGATSASYTANASGSYTVVVTNTSACSATSAATVVTVNALPTAMITAATATTFCQGGSVVLTANTGAGLSYQWRLNGTNITGATSSTYTANASGSYTVVVTNTSTCSATSIATVVTVNALPTATITASSATTFCQGGSVVLNANTGTGLTYQWRLNGTNITGATSSSYTANASGSYTVVVTNTSTCSATSTAIDVTAVPNVDYFADADGDGFGDVTTLISTCFQPQGYVTDNTDCKDNDASIYPGAQEICNDVDDDCNDLIDDGLVFITYYADLDGDTFGDINNPLDACVIPAGYVTNNTDCNDNNANQNAASTEICNGEDDDCDGTIDNGLIFLDYYADLDSDGFGAGAATNSCVDLGAGYVTNNTDCNNANALINPNATEICNSIDDNCNGQIDEGIVFTTYYQDFDNDGFGTGTAVTSCTNPGAGWVTNNTDCDDTNGNTFPGATELCNTIDDNCDGLTDAGTLTVYFIDNDGDSYGNPSVSILACTQPIGYTPDDNDCNDNNANINPGAEDIGGNGIDENCDGEIDNSIFELNASISLYPNPTRSELNIQVNSSIIGNDLYIFDAVGKLVYKQQLLSTQTTLTVSNFADGNYIVRVGEVVKRFVVEK